MTSTVAGIAWWTRLIRRIHGVTARRPEDQPAADAGMCWMVPDPQNAAEVLRDRARIRAALDPIADRFQQSGWLVPSSMGLSARAVGYRLSAFGQRGDRIRAYAPCPGCARLARWLPTRQPHSVATVSGWVV